MRSDARKRLAENTFRGDVLLVGLIGKKRSGKDTFASTLVGERGFERFAFADPLKEAALSLDPLIRVEQDERGPLGDHPGSLLAPLGTLPRLSEIVERVGWEVAKEVREVRRTLQNYGVSIRGIDEDFWVRGTLSRALATPGKKVITDVRFPNEAAAIVAAGGVICRIHRPGLDSTDTHVSETALDGYPADLVVLNSGSLEALAETARHLLF